MQSAQLLNYYNFSGYVSFQKDVIILEDTTTDIATVFCTEFPFHT